MVTVKENAVVKAAPKEASIVRAILRALNDIPGCKAMKTHGSAFGKGQADITGSLLIVVAEGLVVGARFEMEVKVPGKSPTPLQASVLRQWGAAGAVAGCVHSVAEALDLLTPLLAYRH